MAEANQSQEHGSYPFDSARVLAAGANLWLVALVLPFVLARPGDALTGAITLVPVPALGLGLMLLHRQRLIATWLLLGGVPTLTGSVAAILPSLTNQEPFSDLGALLAAGSLLAYMLVTSQVTGQARDERSSSRHGLGNVSPIRESSRRALVRKLLLGVSVVGAGAMVLIAPGASSAFQASYGEAAPEAAVFTTLVATVLGVVVLGVFVGPTQRAKRTPPPSAKVTRGRFVGFMIAFGLGVLFLTFYYLTS